MYESADKIYTIFCLFVVKVDLKIKDEISQLEFTRICKKSVRISGTFIFLIGINSSKKFVTLRSIVY